MDGREQLRIQEIRRRAISDHDHAATYFSEQYRRLSEDYFCSSFTYGRRKLDDLIGRVVSGLARGSRILDVGCGTGEQVRTLRQLGFVAEGLEPSPRMRAMAIERNPGVPIADGVATDLPFANQSFSMVLAVEVLRYLHRADVLQAYGETYRILEPGGCAVFTMVNRYALNGFFLFDTVRRLLFRLMRRREPIHCEFVTPGQVRRDLSKAGFADIMFFGRVIVPLRPFYAIHPVFGAWLARRSEPLDDGLSRIAWTAPLASRLLVVATRPPAR